MDMHLHHFKEILSILRFFSLRFCFPGAQSNETLKASSEASSFSDFDATNSSIRMNVDITQNCDLTFSFSEMLILLFFFFFNFKISYFQNLRCMGKGKFLIEYVSLAMGRKVEPHHSITVRTFIISRFFVFFTFSLTSKGFRANSD